MFLFSPKTTSTDLRLEQKSSPNQSSNEQENFLLLHLCNEVIPVTTCFFLLTRQINGKLFRSFPFCSQGESVGVGEAYQKSKYSHPIVLSSQQKARKQLEKNELICLFDLQIKEKL